MDSLLKFIATPSGTESGLETEAIAQNSGALRDQYDVVVVGAGFAGLVAARDLSIDGRLRILLVEARSRIGGRSWTAKAFGEEFEMGGTWVHWNQPHVYAELTRYDLHGNLKTSSGTIAAEKTYWKPTSDSQATVLNLQAQTDADVIAERIAQKVFSVDGLSSRELMPYPHDPWHLPAPWMKYDTLSVRDRLDAILDEAPEDKAYFEAMLSTFGTAGVHEIGFVEALRWYSLGGSSMQGVFELAGTYKLGHGGMTSFAKAIFNESQADAMFDAEIMEIRQTGKEVELRCKKGQIIRAKRAICTIPLNVLSSIKFSPPVSGFRQEAFRTGHITKGAKVHFKLAATEPGWFGMAAPPASFCFALSDHNGTGSRSDGTWCIGFGYNGHLADPKDSTHVIEQFRQHLRPGADVQAYLTHDWVSDPYSKGTWACWGPGSTSRFLAELQKPHGLVVFASADSADGWRGFVDGALERGKKAAVVIQRDLLAEEGKVEMQARL